MFATKEARVLKQGIIILTLSIPIVFVGGYQRRRYLNQLVIPDDVHENNSADIKKIFGRLGSYRPVAVDNLRKEELTLYQFATCPFCSLVRAFLDVHQIPYRVVEVDPFTKKELKDLSSTGSLSGASSNSYYSKVPVLSFRGGPSLVDSREIVDILSVCFANPRNQLGSGRFGSQVTPRNHGEGSWLPHASAAAASTSPSTPALSSLAPVSSSQSLTQRGDPDIAAWRDWTREALIRYVSIGLSGSISDSKITVGWVMGLDMPTSTKIKCLSMGAVLFVLAHTALSRKLRAAGYPGLDIPKETNEQVALWARDGLRGRFFHGGMEPDIADTDVFGCLRLLEGHPLSERIRNAAPVEFRDWYARMSAYGTARVRPPVGAVV